jgi:hypothetical protein
VRTIGLTVWLSRVISTHLKTQHYENIHAVARQYEGILGGMHKGIVHQKSEEVREIKGVKRQRRQRDTLTFPNVH